MPNGGVLRILWIWLIGLCMSEAFECYDQLELEENTCGIVSLMNAQRLSSDAWQEHFKSIPAGVEERFQWHYRKYFKRFSSYSYRKRRWDMKNGIRPDDLRDGINELHTSLGLPKLTLISLFRSEGDTYQALSEHFFKVTHQSLEFGYTPILIFSRFQKISQRRGGYRWGVVASHVVTLTAVSEGERSLGFQYCDPWGGRMCEGRLCVPTRDYWANDICSREDKGLKKSPCLVVDAQDSPVHSSRYAPHVSSVVVASHVLVVSSPLTEHK